MIRVVIADDIQILRQGLKAILSQDKEIEVTGLASDGKEAFELCKRQHHGYAYAVVRRKLGNFGDKKAFPADSCYGAYHL